MKQKISLVVIIGLGAYFLSVFSCSTKEIKNPFLAPQVSSESEKRVSVMAYNVENLFDTLHDQGKKDFTYLPKALKEDSQEVSQYCAKQKGFRAKECIELNWSEATLEKKIHNVSEVFKQVYQKGPDIVILEEVENLNVLHILNKQALLFAGYTTEVLIEGQDERGIDIGLLSRLPLAGQPILHNIVWEAAKEKDPRGTRGILQVPLELPNQAVLYVFGLHFPSQGNDVEFRKDAINTLKKALDQLPKDSFWLVAGDWNITEEEESEYQLISGNFGSYGNLSHIIGCKDCKGTHNYRKDWAFLDIILFSNTLLNQDSAVSVDSKSITTPMWALDQLRPTGRPNRFDAEKKTGISDHLPIYAELVIKNNLSNSKKNSSEAVK